MTPEKKRAFKKALRAFVESEFKRTMAEVYGEDFLLHYDDAELEKLRELFWAGFGALQQWRKLYE